MIRSLYTATTGMRVQQHKLDSIGNNIANVSTIGYKKTRPNFKDALYDAMGNGREEPGSNLIVGNGVLVDSIQTYFTQGGLDPSDSNLDLSLEGPGFFRKRSSIGQDLFTRDGSFKLGYLPNDDSRLEDSQGNPILDEYGNTIIFSRHTEQEDILIGVDGSILTKNQDGGLTYHSKLGIYNFTDPDGLIRGESGSFIPTDESGPAIVSVEGKVYQGFLERSNVDMSLEMTDLIMAQRAYQFNSRVVQAADDMEKQANSLKG
ncbi:MAG TPA: flagellar hook-basal body protein [Clostridia bacterium]|nr:flagellar hook-basal body protein [Clostridia bacterium]